MFAIIENTVVDDLLVKHIEPSLVDQEGHIAL